MQATTTAVPRPRAGERIMAAINRDPRAAPHGTRNDAVLAAVLLTGAVCLALSTDEGRRPDAVGWALLVAAHVPIVWRRRHPLLVLVGAGGSRRAVPRDGQQPRGAGPASWWRSTRSPSPAARCARS